MSQLLKYGPAVLGQEKFDQLQKQAKGGGATFGAAVLGYKNQPEPPEPPSAPAHLSVRALETVLDADPSKMDYHLSAEWEREGGPRKSALRIFLKMESEKESPRQVLVDRITEALMQE